MIENLIRASSRKPLIPLVLVLGAALLGVDAFRDLRQDVFPDLSAPVFNVIVQNAAMGAEELETAVAIPMETALGGLPGTRRIRSTSQLGVSQIAVEFEPDADYFRSRQFVAEKVQTVALPPGTEPPLLSSLTGRLNEILELTLEAEPGAADLMTLRDLAEFEVQTRLLAVPGVAAVERLGGYLRELQVQLDPDRMVARGISLDEVMHALDGANLNASGGLITQGPMEWGVRAIGRAASSADIGTVVVALRGSTPVLLSEVADVREAPAVRRGIAHRLDGEIVSCRVVKQFGADTVEVARRVRAALDEIRPGLPSGVHLRVAYDQSELVRSSLGGVGRAVLIGAGFVVVVLVLLLGDLRAALLVTVSIPLSVAIAGLLLRQLGVGINTMTLGGLAIAVGLLVDASIIVVENVVHRLAGARASGQRAAAALSATLEVARPITFATAIVIAVFLPLTTMTGIEGRMYGPLAVAVIASMLAALLIALTLTPLAAGLLLRAPAVGAPEDVWLVRRVKRSYERALGWCLRRSGLVRVLALAVTLPAGFLATTIGTDFMPELDEGALLLQTVLPAEASLEEVDRQNHRVEDVLREFPEVEDVVRRTGRSERTEDPMPHTVSDVLVVLKPERGRSLEALTEAMRERVTRVPGVSVLFTTPLGMRIDEGLGGTPADISARVFGPDLAELERLARRVRDIMSGVDGVADLRLEPLTALPELRVSVDRAALARVGLTPGDVIRAVRIGLVGEVVSEVWRGQRRFDLTVRLQDDRRADINAIRSLLIDGHDGSRIPLSQLARIEQTTAPGAIRREAGSRRVAVEAAVAGASRVRRARPARSAWPSVWPWSWCFYCSTWRSDRCSTRRSSWRHCPMRSWAVSSRWRSPARPGTCRRWSV
jgi:cobalt-zinc-cadmium resistance protein CzcA